MVRFLECVDLPYLSINRSKQFGKTLWQSLNLLLPKNNMWEIETTQNGLNIGPVKYESLFTQTCNNLDVSPKHVGHKLPFH